MGPSLRVNSPCSGPRINIRTSLLLIFCTYNVLQVQNVLIIYNASRSNDCNDGLTLSNDEEDEDEHDEESLIRVIELMFRIYLKPRF